MASRRELILQAVVAALGASSKPTGVAVHRYRTRPLERDALPALVVYPAVREGAVAETITRLDHDDALERALRVRVEIRAEGEPPDEALDPLYVWVVKSLRADPTLGGLAQDLEEEAVSFDAAERDAVYAAAAVDFHVTYYTSEDDPEV